jgi:hypothetical protein
MNRFFLLALWLFALRIAQADPVSELASFSVFGKIDPAELAKTDVKTATSAPMNSPQFLSVQSCYLIPGAPSKTLEAMRQWNPTAHRELKVFLHSDLPASPTAENFSRLNQSPENAAVKAFVAATEKRSAALQMSREEAKGFPGSGSTSGSAMPGAMGSFWSALLSKRAQNFAANGIASQPPYDQSGDPISPAKELTGMVRQQPKLDKQFSGFLGETGLLAGKGALKPELYWELLEVEDEAVLTLGAFYSRPTPSGGYQAADGLYYASGGYLVALTLYQLWPLEVEGKTATLVWRGDLISASSLGELHGIERLASESAMKKDISKAVTLFKHDIR